MGMSIDESWGKVFLVQVDYVPSMVIIAYSGNPSPIYSYISLLNLSGKGVYNSGISKEEVRRGFPLGNYDQLFQFLLVQLPSFRGCLTVTLTLNEVKGKGLRFFPR